MYNPETKKCSITRDATWLPFDRSDPKRDMNIFVKNSEMNELAVGIEDDEIPDSQVGAGQTTNSVPDAITQATSAPPRLSRI